MLPTLVKAALPAVPGVNLLPGIRKTGSELPELTLDRHDVPIDVDHAASYAALCGFPRKDVLPLPYPHLLAFGLHLRIMTDGSFPFPAIGTVHLENSITQHRPIAVTEKLQVTARPVNLRPHAKGRVFDMLTTVHSRGELVWEETSTFLRRGPGRRRSRLAGRRSPTRPPTGTTWKLPADLGRTLRRDLRRPQPDPPLRPDREGVRLPAPDRARHVVDGSLRRRPGEPAARPRPRRRRLQEADPAPGHGRVRLATRLDDGYAFSLSNPKSGAPHLAGRTTDLTAG